MKKSYQVLKWTAEVREKELQCLEEVELLDNHDPAVEFESDSESEAYDFLEKESGLLHIHKFDSCGLKFAEVDCLLLQEVEVDEDGDIIHPDKTFFFNGTPTSSRDILISKDEEKFCPNILLGLLTGFYGIKNKPWQPEIGDVYFYVAGDIALLTGGSYILYATFKRKNFLTILKNKERVRTMTKKNVNDK